MPSICLKICGLSLGMLLLLLAPLSALGTEQTPSEQLYYPGVLISQFEGDDAYDPFADYSEFEESDEEEADINFFRNGRFFTLGFIGGYRSFTETMGDIFSDSATFGLFLTYFFDLRFALQLQFLTGDHKVSFDANGTPFRGNLSLTTIGLNLKYYINTQNISRGIAKFNPYIVGGFSQVYRTVTMSQVDAFAKEGAMGFDLGGGIEVPLMRDKMYAGLQLNYQLVSFKDENSEIRDKEQNATGIFPTGDVLYLLAVLGVNF